jgi:hypothetical protein
MSHLLSSPEIELANLSVEFDFYASNPQIHGTYDKEHCHLGSTMYCYQNQVEGLEKSI